MKNRESFIRPIDLTTMKSVKKLLEGTKNGKKIAFSKQQIETILRVILEIEHKNEIHNELECTCKCYYCQKHCVRIQKLLDEV
jgi:hypothetical protein